MHIDGSWFQYLARVLIGLATAIQDVSLMEEAGGVGIDSFPCSDD